MKERYEDLPGTDLPLFQSSSRATTHYSDFRRFEVDVEEEVRLPEPEVP